MTYESTAIAYLFDRIPALANLRGVERLDAEEVIRNAITDAIDDYLADCEMDEMDAEDEE